MYHHSIQNPYRLYYNQGQVNIQQGFICIYHYYYYCNNNYYYKNKQSYVLFHKQSGRNDAKLSKQQGRSHCSSKKVVLNYFPLVFQVWAYDKDTVATLSFLPNYQEQHVKRIPCLTSIQVQKSLLCILKYNYY